MAEYLLAHKPEPIKGFVYFDDDKSCINKVGEINERHNNRVKLTGVHVTDNEDGAQLEECDYTQAIQHAQQKLKPPPFTTVIFDWESTLVRGETNELVSGVVDALQDLNKKGIRLCLLSGQAGEANSISKKLSEAGIKISEEDIMWIGNNNGSNATDNPEAGVDSLIEQKQQTIKNFLIKNNLDPQSVLYVDNDPKCVNALAKVGIHVSHADIAEPDTNHSNTAVTDVNQSDRTMRSPQKSPHSFKNFNEFYKQLDCLAIEALRAELKDYILERDRERIISGSPYRTWSLYGRIISMTADVKIEAAGDVIICLEKMLENIGNDLPAMANVAHTKLSRQKLKALDDSHLGDFMAGHEVLRNLYATFEVTDEPIIPKPHLVPWTR